MTPFPISSVLQTLTFILKLELILLSICCSRCNISICCRCYNILIGSSFLSHDILTMVCEKPLSKQILNQNRIMCRRYVDVGFPLQNTEFTNQHKGGQKDPETRINTQSKSERVLLYTLVCNVVGVEKSLP